MYLYSWRTTNLHNFTVFKNILISKRTSTRQSDHQSSLRSLTGVKVLLKKAIWKFPSLLTWKALKSVSRVRRELWVVGKAVQFLPSPVLFSTRRNSILNRYIILYIYIHYQVRNDRRLLIAFYRSYDVRLRN